MPPPAPIALRLSGRRSDPDRILNLQGAIELVVGSGLIGWGWLMAAFGWANTLFLGVTHLLVELTWTMTLAIIGYRVLLSLSARLSVALVLVWLLAALPVSALLLRPFVG